MTDKFNDGEDKAKACSSKPLQGRNSVKVTEPRNYTACISSCLHWTSIA